MRIGDRVYAKMDFVQDYVDHSYKHKLYRFNKLNSYIVININELFVLINKVIFLRKEYETFDNGMRYFNDYFYTEQEVRKMKLNNIVFNQEVIE